MQSSKPFADSCVIDPTNPNPNPNHNPTAPRLSRSVCSRWLSALLSLLLAATAPVLAQPPPEFEQASYAFEYAGEQTVGAVLGTVLASDADSGDAVTYAITSGDSGRFSVGLTSGVVSYIGSGGEDVTRTPSYGLTITATAGGHAVTALVQVSFGICARTEAVRNRIVDWIGVSDCVDVTVTQLSGIAFLSPNGQGLPRLQSFDFAGLGNLQRLILSSNQLSSVPADVFAGLSSLQFLYLSINQLSSLPAEVFAGLGSLWYLALVNNQLSSVPADVFAGLGSLRILDLRYNQLSSLPADVFAGLGSLQTLWLSSNQLSSLPADVFAGLGSLQELLLDSNQLSSLPADVFAGLGSLVRLWLYNNLGAPFAVELTVEQSGSGVLLHVRRGLPGAPVAVDWDATGAASGNESGTAGIGAGATRSAAITLSASDHTTVTLSNPRMTDPSNFQGFTPSVAAALVLGLRFSETRYAFQLEENRDGSASAIPIGSVAALDPNGDSVSYSLSGGATELFSVGVTDGAVSYIGGGEDAEVTGAYTLTVQATDSDLSALVATVAVMIAITDVDEAPAFTTGYTFDLAENAAGTLALGTVVASDVDSTVSYSLSAGDAARFSVGVTDGAVSYIGGGEDAEVTSAYTLTVQATDSDSSALVAMVAVMIAITDVDEAPAFTTGYTFDLAENAAGTLVLGAVVASDVDSTVSYSLSAGDAARFSVGVTDGAVSYIGGGEDAEVTSAYTLEVQATNSDSSALVATVAVMIAITDEDEGPAFTTGYTFDLAENAAGTLALGTVAASDVDSTVSYSLSAGDAARFSVGVTDGAVSYIGGGEDAEVTSAYTLTVQATDSDSSALAATVAVMIAITDVDEAPAFTTGYTFDLAENAAGTLALGTVVASDVDSTVSYSLSAGDAARFSVGVTDGAVSYIGGGEDAEVTGAYTLTVQATDSDSSALVATVAVMIAITDEDEAPAFTTGYTFDLAENAAGTLALGTLVASDVDSTVSYSLSAGDAARFSVGVTDGAVSYIGGGEDAEVTSAYTLTVQATDSDSSALVATVAVMIAITDEDEGPAFTTGYTFDLAENAAGTLALGTVAASDVDSTVSYSLSAGDAARFSVGVTDGAVSYIGGGEDAEVTGAYTLEVQATDSDSSALVATVAVMIAITDEDEGPAFTTGYTFDLAENAAGTLALGTVAASDVDSTVSYSLSAGDAARFSVGVTDGAVSYIGGGEDAEVTSAYTLTVQATDSDSSALVATVAVMIAITDEDEGPAFTTGYTFDLAENAAGTLALGTVAASDVDSTVSYSLSAGDAARFSVGVTDGAVSYIGGGEDAEVTGAYTLTVQATDSDSSALVATVAVMIAITDEDEGPAFTTGYTFDLAENAAGTLALGTVAASDVDSTVSYSLSAGDAARFSVGVTDGAVSYIGGGEDAEVTGAYTLEVQATDSDSSALVATVAVMIAITDEDEGPAFTTGYTFDLAENAAGTLALGTVAASDVDSSVSYSLSAGDAARFSVGSTDGAVSYIGGGEDAEVTGAYTLTVQATDSDSSALVATVAVMIAITDEDEGPAFTTGYTFDLAENAAGTLALGTVAASDVDSTVSYSLSVGDAARFSVGSTDGAVSYIGGGEDAEVTGAYTLEVQATDSDSSALVAAVAVMIAITDEDEAPAITTGYTFDLAENQAGPVALGTVAARDGDSADSAVSYSLLAGDAERFSVGSTDGAVSYIGGGEDAEATSSYTLTVRASDGDSSALSAATTVLIEVTNVDEAPAITTGYTFDLAENRAGPVALGTVAARDGDSADSAVSYSLLAGDAERFSVGSTDGAVSYIGGGEDAEVTSAYTLTVQATDSDSSALVATVAVMIAITDEDEGPAFTTGYTFDLAENAAGTLALGTVAARDGDSADSAVSYSLSAGDAARFSVGSTDGAVSYIGGGEDAEATSSYTLTVRASDGDSSALSAATTVLIEVTNVDEAPAITTGYTFGLAENRAGPVALGTVAARDGDSADSAVSYSLLAGGAERFSVGSTDGAVSYIGGGEDAEVTSSYTLTVRASDGDSSALSAATTVLIEVTNVDEAPAITTGYTFDLAENQAGPVALGTVAARDGDSADSAVSYSLLAGDAERFSVGSTDGAVSYIGGGEDAEVTSAYTLTVQATDSDSSALVATVAVMIAITDEDEAPAFEQATYVFSINDTEVLVGSVRATDADNETVSYRLLSGGSEVFSVETASGVVEYSGGTVAADVSYTLLVSASDVVGANASAEVRVTVRSTAVMNTRSEMTAVVLADVGRSVAIDALDVLGARFDVGAHVIVSGNTLNLTRWANGKWSTSGQWANELMDPWTGQWRREWAQLSRWMDGEYWQRSSGRWNGREREVSRDFGLSQRWERLEADWHRQWERVGSEWDKLRKGIVSGSSFLMPLGASDGDASTGLTGWSVWGKGHASGYERISGGVKSKSQSLSGYVGADYQATKALLLGVAVSRSKSDGYSEQADDGAEHIDMDTKMTTVWPYANWDSGTGLSLWGALGRGTGTAEIGEGVLTETDIAMSVAVFGVKRRLLSAGSARINVKADGFIAAMESDAVAGYLNATEADSHRLRVALSASNRWRLSKTTHSRAGVELGVRMDGGDSVTGQGLDLGAQIGYSDAALGLTVNSRARLLVAHSEDYREWGLEASIQLRPGMLQRGLSLTLTPRWGRAATDNKLWSSGVTALQRNAGDNAGGRGLMPDQMQLSLSYAWGYGGMVLRPYSELSMQRDTTPEVKLGLKLNEGSAQLSLFGSRARDFGVSSTFRW